MRIVGGLEKKQRRITVERLKSYDIYGNDVEILVVSNGVIKMVHDISPFSCWANGWNRVFVNDTPCVSFAHDYLYDAHNQCINKIFQSSNWGFRFLSLIHRLYFLEDGYDWEDPANLRCPEYFHKRDSITYCIERIIGTNYPTTGNQYVITNFVQNKTPAIYLAANTTDEQIIFRNDSGNEENYTESVELSKNQGFFLKVIRMPDKPYYGSVKIRFYVTEAVDNPRLRVRLGTPQIYISAQTPFDKSRPSNIFPYYYTTYTHVFSTGWNEISVPGDKLGTGVNWLWFDIKESNSSSAVLKIALDTSVKSTTRNLAYHLANEGATALKVVQSFYKLYRDKDIIELRPRVRDVIWWTIGANASAGLTYNFNITNIISEFKNLAPPENPYTRHFKMPIPYYNLAIDDVYISKEGKIIKVTPGTPDFPWIVNPATKEVYVELKSQDGFQFYEPSGIRFVSRTSGFNFKVKFVSQGEEPVKRLAFGIINDPSYGWYMIAQEGQPPAGFTKSNDWVFYIDQAVYGGSWLPKCILDLSGINRVWGVEM